MPKTLCKSPCCLPFLLPEVAAQPEEQEVIDILSKIPCPSVENLTQVQHDWMTSGKHFFHAVEVRHSGCPITLPSWVLTFWQSLASHWRDVFWWRKAYGTLTEEVECEEALQLLATIPWRYRSPIPGAEITDLAWLATTAWLTDNHINLLTWLVNRRLGSSKVRLLEAAYPSKLFDLYKRWKSHSARADSNYSWLNSPRDALRSGKLQQVGFCVYIESGRGLPMTQQQGNHWVAVVIDGRNRRILFGDSQGYSPHASILDMLRWWLRPAFEEEFSIHSLRYNKQSGSWSCADRAVNMVAHHFAPEIFSLMGDTLLDEVQNRIELLVRIVQEIRSLVHTFSTLCNVL
jgi:Ulp1 protease family, C-terminal catalytic domain